MRDPRLYKPLKRGESEQELRRVIKPQPPIQQSLPKATPASGVGWDQQPSERPNVPGTLFTYRQRLDFLGRRPEQLCESEEATYYFRNHRPVAWQVGIRGGTPPTGQQWWISTLFPVLLEFINYDPTEVLGVFIGQFANIWPIGFNAPARNYIRVDPQLRFFINNLRIDQDDQTKAMIARARRGLAGEPVGAGYDPNVAGLVSILSTGSGPNEYFIRFGFDEFAEVFQEDFL